MTLFIIADVIGIAAFAISGLMVGVRHKLDLLGIAIVASLTALGGGIIRDALIHRTPFAFTEYYPSITLFFVLAASVILRIYHKQEIEHRFFFVLSDTIGLVAFSITGAMLGIEHELNLFGILILSFLTAVGGGIIRDVMINQVPTILTQDIYGSFAIFVALALTLLHIIGWLNEYSMFAVGVITLFLRLVAYKHQWHLPKL